MSLKTNSLIILFALLSIITLVGQGNGVNSPFSRFGIGDLSSEAPIYIQQMGGVGASFIDAYHLNFDNPASLAHLRATAFNVGLNLDYRRLSDPNNNSSHWFGNLGNIALGFPLKNPRNELLERVKKKFTWGMGFALMPHSTTSYDISSLNETAGVQVLRNFNGTGGTYKAMWSNAIKYKNLSFGANLGALFGKIDYNRIVAFPESLGSYSDEFSTSYSLKGMYAKFGVIFLHTLNKKELEKADNKNGAKLLSIGLTYKPDLSVTTIADISNLSVLTIGATTLADTLNFSQGTVGNGTLPGELAFGMTYYKGNDYGLSFDYRTTFWSNYNIDPAPETFENTSRFALGGFVRPDFDDINSFFNRVSYRLGVYFEQDPRLINRERISSYGVTLGLGMPLSWQRNFSNLDIGVTIGKRSVDNVLSESFAKFTFGFTFNDSDWFIKRKFN